MRDQLQDEFERELTFAPTIVRTNTKSKVKECIEDPEYTKKIFAKRQERERLAHELEQKRQDEEVASCTFQPFLMTNPRWTQSGATL